MDLRGADPQPRRALGRGTLDDRADARPEHRDVECAHVDRLPDDQSCYAVGAYEQGSPTEHAFSLAWDGRAWKVIPMPESSDTA